MNGDYQSGGGTSSVSLTSSLGSDTVTDSDQFAGMDFEHTVYDGAGGAVVTDTVTVPWTQRGDSHPVPAVAAARADRVHDRDGGDQDVHRAGRRRLPGIRRHLHPRLLRPGHRRSRASRTPPMRPRTPAPTTSYATNTSTWLLDLPAEVTVTSVPPAAALCRGPRPGRAVSDTQTYYDGSTTLGAAPSAGNVTMTQQATSYSGHARGVHHRVHGHLRRVRAGADLHRRRRRIPPRPRYTPATGAEPTSQAVTDPMGLVTTTTYDPARDLPLTVTNPAGWVDRARPTTRSAGSPRSGHPGIPPRARRTRRSATTCPTPRPTIVTTNTINTGGTYLPSETLYDSLGRQVETQTADARRRPGHHRHLLQLRRLEAGRLQLLLHHRRPVGHAGGRAGRPGALADRATSTTATAG